jgi:hypothetical protein
MYSKLGTIVAILMGAFPFFALGWKVTENSTVAIAVYGGIVLILLVGLFLGQRLNLAEAGADGAATRAPREPAPPIEWSWDGVNRQPGEDKE